ncbi:DNA topoisomerase 3 [bacterium]|jgi:DNA topoisomerase III|nr:DNA topoisomerase 3 [bacterium]
MGKQLIIAEKPSVAQDIAKALGIKNKEGNYFEDDSYVLTWTIGHLLEFKDPEDIDKKYKAWRIKELPILPPKFEYKVISKTREQYSVIKKLLKRKDIDGLINACDAGREGELIFREILYKEKSKLPIKRLWLSSMTKASIQKGFTNLLPGEELEGLADAARNRAESDWLIGINGTRAVTKRLQSRSRRTVFSIGRVQTPTLGMVVDRELEILSHVPKPYWRIHAEFQASDHSYKGLLHLAKSEDEQKDRIFDYKKVEELIKGLEKTTRKAQASETRKKSLQSPYSLFDLTSLQRESNQRLGFSAIRTLQSAQRLYEQHKLITYPRTDSKHLPDEYAQILTDSLNQLQSFQSFQQHISPILGKIQSDNRKVFDDAKVSDHFAIIPTGQTPTASLRDDDARVFELILRRVIAVFHPPAEWEVVERSTQLDGLKFKCRGKFLKVPGWTTVYGKIEEEGTSLPPLIPGQDKASDVEVQATEFETSDHHTKPPPRVGEAKLLSLMEYAGKNLESEEQHEVMEGKGIGTPATRADIIENLISKEYLGRSGNSLRATAKSIRLFDVLRRVDIKSLSSVELTADMEVLLREVQSRQSTSEEYMNRIIDYITEIVQQVRDFQYDELYENDPTLGTCPVCKSMIRENLYAYSCEKNTMENSQCDFVVHKELSQRYIDYQSLEEVLEKGHTRDLEFRFPDGKPFTGRLCIGSSNRAEIERLLEDGTYVLQKPKSAQDMQDEETIESERLLDSDYFALQGTFRKTDQAFYFESKDVPKVLKGKSKKFENGPFVGRLPAEICKRPVTEEEAESYFRDGATDWMKSFISKRGRPFNAKLFVKPNGNYGFEFEPRKPRKSEKKPEEKAADSQS